jgi:hypothetical protein
MNIGVSVGFSRIFLLEILIFNGLTARRLYKLLGVKGLIPHVLGSLPRMQSADVCPSLNLGCVDGIRDLPCKWAVNFRTTFWALFTLLIRIVVCGF